MEEQYGIIEAKKPEHPLINLLRVPHQNEGLIVAHPAFGPNTFRSNIKKMRKQYYHPRTGEIISFREPGTSESISAAAYNFESMAKPKIFDPRWCQIGCVRKIDEGVFVNLPLDKDGKIITSEQILKSFLGKDKKVNGIYLLGNGFAYAPRETFEIGVQEGETFARGGLARVLENTPEQVAKNLQTIASKKNYPNGVNVFGFEAEDILRVAGLNSGRDSDGGLLSVLGDDWDDYYGGYAFGVLDSTEGTCKNK